MSTQKSIGITLRSKVARIAIIGSGISGLACADLLAPCHDVMLFEAENRLGGHARTLTVSLPDGALTVDTGFIVYNEINYPLLTKLFKYLEVHTQPSDMSFGVRYGDGELEFCGSSFEGLFAQKKNLLSLRYYQMLADIIRFFRSAKLLLTEHRNPTLAEFLEELELGEWFRDRFLIPMGAAIWSTPPAQMFSFPAKNFIYFFENHGLLSVKGHHPWRTVTGGSHDYVQKLAKRLGERIRLGTAVKQVLLADKGLEIVTEKGERVKFDQVVLAAHADRSLRMIADPLPALRRLLSAFAFRDNEALLHTDETLMPRAKKAWASWVYAAGGPETQDRVSVTYWMNRLQSLKGQNIFVSLNPDRLIATDKILDRYIFRHPMFSHEAILAQKELAHIQGQNGLWFCGAWLRNGFHEDGLWSAVQVAQRMGVPIPWL
ncbi:MAG: NAD(P)/FAD-dependent oxidoreductase [Hyphomicrobium sp.]